MKTTFALRAPGLAMVWLGASRITLAQPDNNKSPPLSPSIADSFSPFLVLVVVKPGEACRRPGGGASNPSGPR